MEDLTIQLGVSLDDEGRPVVLMVLPGIQDPDTGEDDLTVMIGTPDEVLTTFIDTVARTARVAAMVEDYLTGDEDAEEVELILNECAWRVSAEYN